MTFVYIIGGLLALYISWCFGVAFAKYMFIKSLIELDKLSEKVDANVTPISVIEFMGMMVAYRADGSFCGQGETRLELETCMFVNHGIEKYAVSNDVLKILESHQ